MKERIFFIHPLAEEDDEEKLPYDKQGNTTAMAYYDEHGSTVEPEYQEQPEEESTIEKHIIIIYEAPKQEVIPQQNTISEATPAIPTLEQFMKTSPNQTLTPAPSENPYQQIAANTQLASNQVPSKLLDFLYPERHQPEPPSNQVPSTLLDFLYGEERHLPEPPSNQVPSTLLDFLYPERHASNQLAHVRAQLSEISNTTATGEPGAAV